MNIKPIDIIIVFIYNMAPAKGLAPLLTVLETAVLLLHQADIFNLFGITISPVIVKNINRTKTSVATISANITIKDIKSSSSISFILDQETGFGPAKTCLEGRCPTIGLLLDVPPPKSHNTSIAISRNRTTTAMVGMTGLESATSCAQSMRATKLHHIPI